VVPFVILLVPWFMVTETYLQVATAILLFSLLGYLAYGGILLVVSQRLPPGRRTALIGVIFVGLIVSSGTWPLMSRPAIHELENAVAYAFFGWALFFVVCAEFSVGKRLMFACATGLAGLALGCRPNYFPAVAIVVLYILYRSLQPPGGWGNRASRLIYPLLPLVIISLGLAWWNYHRFDSPWDFGVKQFSQTSKSSGLLSISSQNIPYNAYKYILGSARLGRYFPFIQGEKEGPFNLAENQQHSNQVYGFLLVSPVILWAFFLFLAKEAMRRPGISMLAAVLLLAGLGNLLYLSLIGFSCYRYSVDFLGPLACLAALGALGIDTLEPGLKRRLLFTILGLTVTWSACWAIFETCSIAEVHALFDQKRPEDLKLIAWPFNSIVYRVEQIANHGPQALRLNLQFPEGKFGQVEPLVVSGKPPAQDFLYVYYTSPGKIQFGFESMGHGGPVTGPINTDYNTQHLVDVFLGGFLPPDDHPLVSGLSKAELDMARRIVRIRLDGKVILESAEELHPVLARIFIGESPDDPAFGRNFTGKINSVERPLLKNSYYHPEWTADMFGPLALTLKLKPMPEHTGEPILSVGYRPSGGVLAIEHLKADEIRLVWTRFGQEPIYSAPIKWAYDLPHNLEFRAGSLFPPSNSTLWKQADAAWIAQKKTEMICKIDGHVILDIKVETPDISPNELFVGQNMLGISGISESLLGSVVSTARETW
jgi:hypothetical protein